MLNKENEYYSASVFLIAGCDEAGRGPLAGPVCAAAVVFPKNYENPDINDSKKLTEKKRDALFEIVKHDALGYGIAMRSAEYIDLHNIYEASRDAMKDALSQIKIPYQLVLSDAMPMPGFKTPVIPIIKGDAQCLNIAGASILAKVTRDRYMDELQKQYPNFSFGVHKGYGTKKHMEELQQFGPIEGVHRKTFGPVAKFYREQLTLF
ncbi:MAG: ribonuclease HII [Bacilli bacterium]|nr:ribonuclease HII [Bacilli bacterium]